MRRQTATLKRACSALIAQGVGALVPLLWPGDLASSEAEWAAAFESDETEAAPVAFFCTGCAGHYNERRADATCIRCGVEFMVSLQVPGGRTELAKGDHCLVCREENKQELAAALGYGGEVGTSPTPAPAVDTYCTVGLDDLPPHHDSTRLVRWSRRGVGVRVRRHRGRLRQEAQEEPTPSA
jgi:hypothetical protein